MPQPKNHSGEVRHRYLLPLLIGTGYQCTPDIGEIALSSKGTKGESVATIGLSFSSVDTRICLSFLSERGVLWLPAHSRIEPLLSFFAMSASPICFLSVAFISHHFYIWFSSFISVMRVCVSLESSIIKYCCVPRVYLLALVAAAQWIVISV